MKLLVERLRDRADPAVKAWWEGYVKESAPFLGVKMPQIRAELHRWHKEVVASSFEDAAQTDLALALFQRPHTEEKLAGILFLQELLIPRGALSPGMDLDRFARLFDDGLLYDWNVCDWFCVKVLGPLIQAQPEAWAETVSGWHEARNLWRARASVVGFVQVAGRPDHYPAIARSCGTLIRRPERFAKTAVGWILREISRFDQIFVLRVIETHLHGFTPESLTNATKYLDAATRKRYAQLLKSRSGRRIPRSAITPLDRSDPC